jgi:large subunit ribosomal protein L29
MNVNELRELTKEELEIKVNDLKRDLMDTRFLLATSQIEDTSVFKKLKKQIAQALTILNEKNVTENLELSEKTEEEKV